MVRIQCTASLMPENEILYRIEIPPRLHLLPYLCSSGQSFPVCTTCLRYSSMGQGQTQVELLQCTRYKPVELHRARAALTAPTRAVAVL